MKVKNNYTTHLGLGELRILPGETVTLPNGYGENHPVVKYYISRGWLIVVSKGTGKGKAEKPAQVNVALNTGNANDGGEKMHLDPEQFDGWETEQIFRLAADMGIELGDTPERDDIISKIAAEEVEVSEYSDLNPEDYNPEDEDDNNAGDVKADKPLPFAEKPVDKLSLDELKTLAAAMKLEAVDDDTRKTLIEKIKAAKKENE